MQHIFACLFALAFCVQNASAFPALVRVDRFPCSGGGTMTEHNMDDDGDGTADYMIRTDCNGNVTRIDFVNAGTSPIGRVLLGDSTRVVTNFSGIALRIEGYHNGPVGYTHAYSIDIDSFGGTTISYGALKPVFGKAPESVAPQIVKVEVFPSLVAIELTSPGNCECQLEIFASSGQQVCRWQSYISEGRGEVKVPQKLTSGVYVVSARMRNSSCSKKFVVY
jgi:hypothetical protein